MEITKESKFKYNNIPVTLQELVILNPVLFRTYFTSNSSYTLSENALECVNKIRNKEIKAKVLTLDKYRKKLIKERKLNELYNSSSDLKMGDCATLIYHGVRTRHLLFGI